MSVLAVLCLLLLQTGAHGFGIFGGESLNHQEITERAILNTTVQVCRTLALAKGQGFTFPPQPFTAESVVAACEASKSSKSFRQAITLIQDRNVRVDLFLYLIPRYHFNNEEFTAGRQIITDGLSAVKASIKQDNFETARQNLGKILHPLQDFYSHSNWVEMGNTLPNSNLIRPGTVIGDLAAVSRATCRNCDGDDCRNNILEDILQEKILTSGYFGFKPFATKPAGKCSHGGRLDRTSKIEPIGGISKDELDSSHGHLHTEAANVAIAATSQLLEDVRGAAGDKPFLQMMGINKGSNKALCFVIDTTGSMSDDIAAVRDVTASIINEKVGTEEEPSLYILVPFSDPEFGPLTRTTDPEVFRNAINSLSASGGGDVPEMSLSGLQLALTGAPPNSEIFLFTDAPAKDTHLRGTVMALIERTKTVVNFMITNVLGSRRRRQSENNQQQQRQSRISGTDTQLYRDLAQASGGQAVEVSKSELLTATSIITDSSTSPQVTLLQAARSPGRAEKFTLAVDESIRNLTIYFTGRSVIFTLTSPTGVSLSSNNLTGSLVITSQSVGNFQTLQLKVQAGLWTVQMMSTSPYTLKVVAESSIDFLFDFLEVSQGPLGGFDVLENRPRAGVNGSLRVTLIGSDSVTVTEVILIESSGAGQVNGSVQPQGKGVFFVQFDRIPSVEFVVLIKGNNNDSSAPFQRQSSTSIRASSLTVTAAETDDVLAPGVPLSIPFSVVNSSVVGSLDIRVSNDQNFTSVFPSSLSLDSEGRANGTVNLTAPSGTPSGTDVTLTIEATDPGSGDTNYVVLLFTVLTRVTDFTPPVCQRLTPQPNCSTNCSAMWELSVQVTDGPEGSGVERVSLRQGEGTMNTSLAPENNNITLVSYKASCCSPDVEIVVVDRVGNVDSCFYTAREDITTTNVTPSTTNNTTNTTTNTNTNTTTCNTNTPTNPTTPITNLQPPTAVPQMSSSTKAAQSLLLCLSVMILGLSLPSGIGISGLFTCL